ncbi:MAG: nitrogen-specific signal transduction histidine kinase [Bermanella sp.]
MDEAVREHIYDPFVTTKRNQGSTGLGMNIVHNLVIGKLAGNIELLPTSKGTTWKISLPKEIAV